MSRGVAVTVFLLSLGGFPPFGGFIATRFAARFPEQAPGFVAGGLGENLSTEGADESAVCVGDVWAFGTARLQLSQIVHGVRRPGLDTALRIEDATGIPVRSWADIPVSGPAKRTFRRTKRTNVNKAETESRVT